jgi:hypothetical protein
MKHSAFTILSTMLILLGTVLEGQAQAYSQRSGKIAEVGVSLGGSTFWGDLAGSKDKGSPFVRDFEWAVTRPAVGAFFRYNFSHVMSIRFNGYYTIVAGDDALTNAVEPGQDGYARKYRNLSFRSNIFEASTMLDINLMPYIPGNENYAFTIYLTGGVGAFYFNPQAQFEGEWVDLQPLGTEGQGLPEYRGKEKYSRIAFCFPMGVGLKYNFNEDVTLSFEISHRLTTTDYIDDVSTVYPDPAYFALHYDDQKAALATSLADRSPATEPARTAPGQQRGDPSDFDGYTYSGIFSLSFALSKKGNTQLYCPRML